MDEEAGEGGSGCQYSKTRGRRLILSHLIQQPPTKLSARGPHLLKPLAFDSINTDIRKAQFRQSQSKHKELEVPVDSARALIRFIFRSLGALFSTMDLQR